ncbi:PREDICTED: protein Wnt-11b-2-like [Wasmannia auropunctata]|uniref:protein Wnt-11b-2-like n=1 Tax=Wasmannia auropunctata TaxID=64793 RepID=UPI0005EDDF27|nr:PREDICTED: protein Wnt-11b-2-like [Wasmannia auropunctata]
MRIKKRSDAKVWLLLLVLLLVQDGRCIKWLGLGRTGDTHTWTREACTSAKGAGLLERKQARACRAAPDVMPALVQAAKDTSTVCQQAFRHRRWNCSSIERAPDYTPELLTGTREQAFVYAMSAAAAVWRLARGCALGSLAACSCATPPRREPPSPSALISPSSFTTMPVSFDTLSARNSFKWGGCGDDVRSASRMAKRFLQGATPPGTGGTAKFMHAVNMHNNRAGRRAVEQSLTLECKCHGVSGSCSVRTCWRGLGASGPSAAGSRLLRRYATAAEVRPRSGGRLPPLYHHDNLLYTTKSPDYCLPDKKRGSLGTIGRQCNGSSSGYESCEYLCCGRGHVTRTEEVYERCDCKYISCCYVRCKTCSRIVKTYECN